jgi:hypothetical protein
MTLAVEIAVGSRANRSPGVAGGGALLFRARQPMSLLFNAFEITAIVLSVFATVTVVKVGESNRFEGLLLLAVYLILTKLRLKPTSAGCDLRRIFVNRSNFIWSPRSNEQSRAMLRLRSVR